jgi:hypothetical protein
LWIFITLYSDNLLVINVTYKYKFKNSIVFFHIFVIVFNSFFFLVILNDTLVFRSYIDPFCWSKDIIFLLGVLIKNTMHYLSMLDSCEVTCRYPRNDMLRVRWKGELSNDNTSSLFNRRSTYIDIDVIARGSIYFFSTHSMNMVSKCFTVHEKFIAGFRRLFPVKTYRFFMHH